jgi:hypothetical protein
MDIVINANCTSQVIPSAKATASEVLRQQHQQHVDEHGTSVSRERWMEHVTVPDMIRDYSLAYRDTDVEGRQVYCPVCPKYRAGDGSEIVNMYH